MNCPRDNTNLTLKIFKQQQIYSCSCCKGLWLPGDIVQSLLSSSANGRIRKLQQTNGSTLSCPRKCADLLEMRINGIVLDVCASCNGVWLDRGEIEAVMAKTPSLRRGTKSEPDSVVFSVLDGAGWFLPDLLEALFDGLFDGV